MVQNFFASRELPRATCDKLEWVSDESDSIAQVGGSTVRKSPDSGAPYRTLAEFGAVNCE